MLGRTQGLGDAVQIGDRSSVQRLQPTVLRSSELGGDPKRFEVGERSTYAAQLHLELSGPGRQVGSVCLLASYLLQYRSQQHLAIRRVGSTIGRDERQRLARRQPVLEDAREHRILGLVVEGGERVRQRWAHRSAGNVLFGAR